VDSADGKLGNYDVTLVNGDLEVTPAALTVTVRDASRTYGDVNPAFAVDYAGFAPGEAPAALGGSLAFGTVATLASSVGSYPVWAAGLTSANYAIHYADGTLTVGPRAVSVAADAQGKIYGQSDPALTYRITGGALVNGDTFTGGLARDPGEDAGRYTIRQDMLALNGNYSLTYVGANLTISPAQTTTALTSSASPSSLAQPVTLTAMLAVVAPGADTPGGSVTFMDGTTPLATVPVVNGSATYTTSGLSRGDHSLTAMYANATANFAGSTAPALVQSVLNGAPVADSFTADAATAAVTIPVLAHASDPDGDVLAISGVTQGANGTVTINPDGTVTYALARYVSGTDTFTYTVGDGFGGTATGTVTVNVQASPVQGTTTLRSQVAGLPLDPAQKTILDSALRAAELLMGMGQPSAAVLPLDLFILDIQLLKRSGGLSATVADQLIGEAQAVIALLA
jgi:hypothetical protein